MINIDSSHTGSRYNELKEETLTLTQDLVQDLMLQIQYMENFGQDHLEIIHVQLLDLTSSLTQFIELTTLMARTLNLDKKIISDIKNSHIHLLFILKGLYQANAKSDIIVLEDLIKHELKDNLTQWKINFLPAIKKPLNP